MLCDEIAAAAGEGTNIHFEVGKRTYALPSRRLFSAIGQAISESQRFNLTRDVVHAALHVSQGRPSSILNGLPLCRLPYETTWIEFAETERAEAFNRSAASRSVAVRGAIPRRVGFLVQAVDDTLQRGAITCAWVHNRQTPDICPLAIAFDFTGARLFGRSLAEDLNLSVEGLRDSLSSDPRFRRIASSGEELRALLELNRLCAFCFTPPLRELVDSIERRAGRNGVRRILEDAEGNLSGEFAFFMAVLMLLNSRNAIRVTDVETPTRRRRNRRK